MGAFKLLQAAGVIHNDFERGFIKAETTAYADLVEFGGEQGAKEKGKVRMLGNNCAFVHAHITRASTHTHTHTHRCAWRAKTTSSLTATAFSSASTSDMLQRLTCAQRVTMMYLACI